MATCPTCNRHFDEDGGFCPFDGARLDADGGGGQVLQAVSAKEESSAAAALRALSQGDGSARNEYDRLVGTTLDGRYYIESKIGEGGMGVVFAARHIVIEKKVAIKVLKREVARDHSTVKRFVQEAKAASRIGHPGIVDVTDFGTTPDGMTYSVMEFVEGDTLSKVIKSDAPMPVARLLPIAAQIAKALAAAHEKGIVHRDLKPENVFVIDRDGRRDFVKIVDFGIAKVTPVDGDAKGPRLTRAGTVFGTPEYMAPEQAAGRPDTDQRADVYALGTIMYEMLTGRVPHKGDSMVRTLAMQMLDPITPPSQVRSDLDISAELEQVIMTALAKKREDRYQTMSELLRSMKLVSGGVSLSPSLAPGATGAPGAASTPDARTLVPDLPPGASPSQVGRSQRTTMKEGYGPGGVPTETPAEGDAPRGKGTDRRKRRKSEPAFVDAERKPVFDDIYDDDRSSTYVDSSPRWPLVLAALLLLGGGAAAVAFLASSRDDDAATVEDVEEVADAGAIAETTEDAAPPADATLVAEIPLDAGDTAVVDPDGVNRPPHRRPDAGVTRRRTHTVQVITKPDGGTLYINQSYRGPSGTNVSGVEGEKTTITCRKPGYKNGKVEITFDGVAPVAICLMKRDKRCIKDLKNPFDECPD